MSEIKSERSLASEKGSSSSDGATACKKSKRSSSLLLPKANFPSKLYAILELADNNLEVAKAVTWLPHGRAFKIVDKDTLMKVVPMFFNQTKIRSFNRQLNLWGFKRYVNTKNHGIGSDDGQIWYHDNFLRGLPERMKLMVRVKIKGDKTVDSRGVDSQPPADFDKLPPLPSNDGPLPLDVLRTMEQVLLQLNAIPGASSENTATLEAAAKPDITLHEAISRIYPNVMYGSDQSTCPDGFHPPFCPLARGISNESIISVSSDDTRTTSHSSSGSAHLNNLHFCRPLNLPFGRIKHHEDFEPLPFRKDDNSPCEDDHSPDDFARFIGATIQHM